MVLPMRLSLSHFEIITFGEIAVFLSGFLVGGMAMIMDMVLERRMGDLSVLLGTPATLPASYREFFAYFYVKDMMYYILMVVLPVVFGLFVSTFLTGLHVDLPMAVLSMVLAFVLGMSVAFSLSAVVARSRLLFAIILISGIEFIFISTIGQTSVLSGLGRFFPPVGIYMNGSVMDVFIAIAIIIVLTSVSLVYLRVKPHHTERRVKNQFGSLEKRLSIFGRHAALVAKEWSDLKRSGVIVSVLFSFFIPLLFLWGLIWMLSGAMSFLYQNETITMPFNTVFYAIIIGFFGCLVYGWLNNIDNNSSYRLLPVTMTDIIKAKLILFFILNTVVSVVYLGFISFSRGELWPLFPVSLYTMFMVSGYTGILTAYLTGIYTNSLMFDYKVLTLFSLALAPLLIILIILSFGGIIWAMVGIASFMGVTAYLILCKIDSKWGRAEFKTP